MIPRRVTSVIERYSREFPVLVILGPRQVGKTTLVKRLANKLGKKHHYLDLESTAHFEVLSRDAESYLREFSDECVVIDEVQRMPGLFPLLRSLVDEKRRAARFVLTGSASPGLLKGASESLAGRVYYFHLHPIGLNEIPERITTGKHWLRGGFPRPLTMKSNALAYGWLDSFITTYVERDLPLLFDVKLSPQIMRKLWGMLAHLQGDLLNHEKLAASLAVSASTVRRYLDFLEGAFLLRRLQPFHISIAKRLVKAPKTYIADSGILHCLLRIGNEKDLAAHPSAGASWEGYVITQVLSAAAPRTDGYFYRTHQGSECDLVLVYGSTVLACIEIRLGASPAPSKGFYNALEDLGCSRGFIICTTERSYRNRQGTLITGLREFLEKHLPQLR